MTEILGREVEIAAIEEFLAGRAADARAARPGRRARHRQDNAVALGTGECREPRRRVLRAQPAEAEQELAFATLGDVLAEVHDEIGALPEPQRRALRIALLLDESDGRLLDERVVGTAFANLLREIAGDGVAPRRDRRRSLGRPLLLGLHPFRADGGSTSGWRRS